MPYNAHILLVINTKEVNTYLLFYFMTERHFYSPEERRISKQPPVSRQKFETIGDYHYQYVGQDITPKTKRQEQLTLRAKRWGTIYRNRIIRGDFSRLDRVELTDEQRAIAWQGYLKNFVPDSRTGVRFNVTLAELVERVYGDQPDDEE